MNSNPENPYRSIIFDLDGVIIDSIPIWIEAKKTAVENNGLIFTRETALRYIGSPVSDYFQSVILENGLPVDNRLVKKLVKSMNSAAENRYLAGVQCMPHVRDILKSVSRAGLRVGVCSNSPRHLVDSALKNCKSREYIDQIISGDDLNNPKPSPECYTLACRSLCVRPDEAVAVEDSLPGLKSARSAGLDTIYFGRSLDENCARIATHVVADLVSIPQLVLRGQGTNDA